VCSLAAKGCRQVQLIHLSEIFTVTAGSISQLYVRTRTVGILHFFALDFLENFLAVNRYVGRGLDPQAHYVATDFQSHSHDVLADHDLATCTVGV